MLVDKPGIGSYLKRGLLDLGKSSGELLGCGSDFPQHDDGVIGAVDGEFSHFFDFQSQLLDGAAAFCQFFLGSHALHGQHCAANLDIRGRQFQQDV